MTSTMPRFGKKSLFLLCCAFILGYRSILDLNSSSLSQKGKSFRNLNEGGLIGFVLDVVAPFLAALKSKFRDIDEEIQVVQITSSPTPSDIVGNVTTFEGNTTTNSTGDERWCLWWCDTTPTPAPTPAPTYFFTKDPEYLNSDVHCGRWYLILIWWYQTNHIDYEIYNQDGTDFESEKSPSMQHDILEATKQSLTDYWQCREDNGHYDAFVGNMHKRPRLEARFVLNVVKITCMDACGGSVMCKDLTVPKIGDECYSGDFQDILTDPDARVVPRFDYKIEYDVGGTDEADTEHQTYEYNVETLQANPVQRQSYGTWITSSISDGEKNVHKENLKELFEQWSFDVDEARYNNYCDDLDEDGRTVECTLGRVSYIDVDLGNNVGFSINKLKNFKNTLTELHIEMNAERSFPSFSQFKILKILEINANERLSGELPATIGGATELKVLEINSGGLEGSIPTEIGHLQKLLLLDLGNNDFDGSIPDEFYNMNKLKAVYLHKNEFTGTVSTKIGGLNKLKQISLQDNRFSGPFPTQVNQLNNLRVFDLQRGGFSGPFPDITGLNKLKIVALNGNDFNGGIPENIGDLTNLQFLNLKNNNLTGTVPASLANCLNLKRLILDGNNLVLSADLEAQLLSNGIEHLSKP